MWRKEPTDAEQEDNATLTRPQEETRTCQEETAEVDLDSRRRNLEQKVEAPLEHKDFGPLATISGTLILPYHITILLK